MFLTKKKVLLSAIALLIGMTVFSSQAVAQEKSGNSKLVGKVVDASSQQPVSGATVSIQGKDLETTTDQKGMYTFDSVQPGAVTITVEADGYQSWEKKVELKNQQNTLSIKLKPEKGK